MSSSSLSSNGKPERPPAPRRVATTPVAPPHPNSYIALTPPPLQPELLRWFYHEHNKVWKPFSGQDSLRLEEARCLLLSESSLNPLIETKEVEVMGNMFTVDIHVMQPASLLPIYWTSKPWPVLRGSWFEALSDKIWNPLSEEEAAILEEAHVRRDWREKAKADAELSAWASSRSMSIPDERRGSQPQNIVVLNQVTCTNFEAMWIGENEVMKVKTDPASKIWSKMGEKIGRGQLYGATKLVRGYKEPCSPKDGTPPIGHLVFVIHGIGQNMDASDIVKSAADLRETCKTTALKHFPDYWNKGRVEFIPIEWRTWLSLDQGMLASITPHGVKSLRGLVNDSVLDVMFYLSPRFGPEILDGLRWQLNKKYGEFMRRNTHFLSSGGTVSLFGHSLGSVMCYDLLHENCRVRGLLMEHQQTSSEKSIDQTDGPGRNPSDDEFDELQQLRLRVAELESRLGIAKEPKVLKFNVDHLFAVGSPLGIFILLREHAQLIKKDVKGADSFLPNCVCKRIHNLHHPSDPVAYRLEPLINSVYAQIKPVKVDSASNKPSQKSKTLAEGPKTPDPSPTMPPKNSWTQSLFTAVMKTVGATSESYTSKSLPPEKVYDDDSKLNPEERLKERLDFMLRESIVENSYLNAITAHTCYWTSADCAMYLLLQVYLYKKEL